MKRNTIIFLLGILLLVLNITLYLLGVFNNEAAFFVASLSAVMIGMPIVLYIFNEKG
ncbi:hypothetical protein [Myroides sp. LJL119]